MVKTMSNEHNGGPNPHELNEKIGEIREWLVRIDTKVDNLAEVRRTAEDAKADAAKANGLAQENKEDIVRVEKEMRRKIDEIKANDRWKWGVILTIAGFLITTGIAVFNKLY